MDFFCITDFKIFFFLFFLKAFFVITVFLKFYCNAYCCWPVFLLLLWGFWGVLFLVFYCCCSYFCFFQALFWEDLEFFGDSRGSELERIRVWLDAGSPSCFNPNKSSYNCMHSETLKKILTKYIYRTTKNVKNLI